MTEPVSGASELAQALAGEAVLRHVAGRRVLDLGHGAPEITQWVRRAASKVSVAPLAELDQHGDTLQIPAADATYDAVYCLRTLPHLGRDEESSLALVRSLLQEAVRVTAPGGLLLLEINNPRSLRGLAHGIRHPITIVAAGGVLVEGDHHVTRYDSLGRLLKLAPASWSSCARTGSGCSCRSPGSSRGRCSAESWRPVSGGPATAFCASSARTCSPSCASPTQTRAGSRILEVSGQERARYPRYLCESGSLHRSRV
ncbi:class I SAM-dependent methyltransferase [Nannocystis pusilla]|uniref:class I SAM-dependent methyltransferase n=1 Tax=Nannocystis pusilla TaxID=889268 RepID=UPI003B7BD83C